MHKDPLTRREQCDRLIEVMVGPDWIETWWNSPNKAFQGRTPTEQFSIDEESVYNYLMDHAYGW